MPNHWAQAGKSLIDLALIATALLLAYGAAGFVGGSIPANADWRPPERGIQIFVETNGVHTDLVVPVRAAGVDWSAVAHAQDIVDPRYAAWPYVAFGWGDERFYLETPTWADVRPGTVIRAMIGDSRTLVHVTHLPRPDPAPDVRPILLTEKQYIRLSAFIRSSFADPRPGRPRKIFRGYDSFDAFYSASGRYDGLMTCNTWTGQALRVAGVRVGAWTPFATTVMGWF